MQTDYDIVDQAGLSFLADLNTTLGAIVSNNSGATQPATTFAYMWWADTTSGVLKQRNAANSAWVNKYKLNGGGLAELAGGTSANFTAMPQVGGDPIVESGSNADGEFTKFADGTQICVSGFLEININELTGSVYRSTPTGLDYTFPVLFNTAPSVLTHTIIGSTTWGGGAPVVSTSSAELRAFASTSRTSEVQAVAIGRWK